MAKNQDGVKVVISIVERHCGANIVKLFKKQNVKWHYQCVGRGTASSDLLEVLGFATAERDIILSMASDVVVDKLMYDLNNDLRMGLHINGIAFDVPLTGLDRFVTDMLLAQTVEEGESVMVETGQKHALILAVVNQGYTDDVMDTAKKGGARGGTIIKGRWVGSEDMEKYFDIRLQTEKEIIAIVVSTATRNKVMELINEEHGKNKKAGAMVCCMGVDSLVRWA